MSHFDTEFIRAVSNSREEERQGQFRQREDLRFANPVNNFRNHVDADGVTMARNMPLTEENIESLFKLSHDVATSPICSEFVKSFHGDVNEVQSLVAEYLQNAPLYLGPFAEKLFEKAEKASQFDKSLTPAEALGLALVTDMITQVGISAEYRKAATSGAKAGAGKATSGAAGKAAAPPAGPPPVMTIHQALAGWLDRAFQNVDLAELGKHVASGLVGRPFEPKDPNKIDPMHEMAHKMGAAIFQIGQLAKHGWQLGAQHGGQFIAGLMGQQIPGGGLLHKWGMNIGKFMGIHNNDPAAGPSPGTGPDPGAQSAGEPASGEQTADPSAPTDGTRTSESDTTWASHEPSTQPTDPHPNVTNLSEDAVKQDRGKISSPDMQAHAEAQGGLDKLAEIRKSLSQADRRANRSGDALFEDLVKNALMGGVGNESRLIYRKATSHG